MVRYPRSKDGLQPLFAVQSRFALHFPVLTAGPIKTSRAVLPNGLQVVVQSDHTSLVVAVSITYKVGSQHETPGLSGFAHFFEHLMAQGTRAQTPRDLPAHRVNGGVNAYTMKTNTYHS